MQDVFWDNVTRCLDRIAADGGDVEAVIAILNDHFTPEGGDAFFGGSGGDRQLLDVFTYETNGWKVTWSEASYYYVIADPNGALMTYVEGDVYRGDRH